MGDCNNVTHVDTTTAKAIVRIGDELSLQGDWDEFVITKEAYIGLKEQLEKDE